MRVRCRPGRYRILIRDVKLSSSSRRPKYYVRKASAVQVPGFQRSGVWAIPPSLVGATNKSVRWAARLMLQYACISAAIAILSDSMSDLSYRISQPCFRTTSIRVSQE